MIQSLPALRQQFLAEHQGFLEFAVNDPRTVQPDLKHYTENAAMAQLALLAEQPGVALDADASTLHIRCGHDVMYKLAVCGFKGDFLSFADPYIQGPVPAQDDETRFIHTRADFIANNHWRSKQQALDELSSDYQALENGRNYQRVAFWFEHDAYDVLVFLKMLHFFNNPARRASIMQFVCIDHYPGVQRFNGIGQLPAETMRVLWEQFQPLDDAQFEYGKRCWQAYTDSTPEAFIRLMSQENPPLPEIVPALQRHIRELPWVSNGITLSEHITLQILADQGTLDAANLFYRWYTGVYEPLPFMGDSSYWILLEQLADAPCPAIIIQKASEKKTDWRVAITPFGRDLLERKAHWLKQNPYDRWWGGTHNQSEHGIWCWDESTRNVTVFSTNRAQ